MDDFKVLLMGIIFDPKERKILIGRRENDPHLPDLSWCFIGGDLAHNEEVDKSLKRQIKEKTGYEVKNLGAIFAKVVNETGNWVTIYYLCEVFGGEEKPDGKTFKELKWVDPEELESHFKTSFNSRLKEYLINLK